MTKNSDPDKMPATPHDESAGEIDGKSVPKNALIHGHYSKETILPWESEAEFEELHREYRDEFDPRGAFEEDIVGQITQLQWHKRRLLRGYRLLFATDPLAQDLTDLANPGSEGIEHYIRRNRASAAAAAKAYKTITLSPAQFKEYMDRKVAEAFAADPSLAQGDGPEYDPPTIPLTDPIEAQADLKEAIRATEALLERLYRPDELDRFLRSLGSLDARIEKAIARLVGVKEFKRQYRVKEISLNTPDQSSTRSASR